MNKNEILNLDDDLFLEWVEQVFKEKRGIKPNNITKNMIPYLKEIIKKYYKNNDIIIKELPDKIILGSKTKTQIIFNKQNQDHLTKEQISKIINKKMYKNEEYKNIELDKKWLDNNNSFIKEEFMDEYKFNEKYIKTEEYIEEYVDMYDLTYGIRQLKEYTHHYDGIINNALRNDKIISHDNLERIKIICEMINMANPYPKKICLYRGVKHKFTKILETMKIGDKIIDKGFSSQTLNFDIAENYVLTDDKIGSMMILCYPKGMKFLYIDSISEYQGEEEILTYPNLKLELIDIKNYRHNYNIYVFSVNKKSYIETIKFLLTYKIEE